LGAHNYGTWAKEVEAYCMMQQDSDIWLTIDLDTEVPTMSAKLAEWKKHNLFTYEAIYPDHYDTLCDITPATILPGLHSVPITSKTPLFIVSSFVNSFIPFPIPLPQVYQLF
jgi:hypothetical protein